MCIVNLHAISSTIVIGFSTFVTKCVRLDFVSAINFKYRFIKVIKSFTKKETILKPGNVKAASVVLIIS